MVTSQFLTEGQANFLNNVKIVSPGIPDALRTLIDKSLPEISIGLSVPAHILGAAVPFELKAAIFVGTTAIGATSLWYELLRTNKNATIAEQSRALVIGGLIGATCGFAGVLLTS